MIQWKAGDRTWATYREVAHLNALDRYCELMGVKGAADLAANYEVTKNENNDVKRIKGNSDEDKREDSDEE